MRAAMITIDKLSEVIELQHIKNKEIYKFKRIQRKGRTKLVNI